MCISQNNLYKQHHTIDYLRKPVTYSKSLVHLPKISIYVQWHFYIELLSGRDPLWAPLQNDLLETTYTLQGPTLT